MAFLDRNVKTALPGMHNDEWQPLVSYRSSLQHQELEVPANRVPGRQYRGRKRDRDDEDEDGEEGEELTLDFSENAE